MGFWGSTLYANDCTTDVRDDYKNHLKDGLNNDEAFRQVMSTYADCMDTDAEPLVWYALADTQWNLGCLMPEVKEKASWWIDREGGMNFWEDSASHGTGWKKTLARLKEKINTPQPPEKTIKKTKQFVKNPWNVGDVYAYCFHTEEAKEKEYFGKYILIQKLGDNDFFTDTLSVVRVFDKLFDEIPTDINLENIRLLPFSLAKTFMPSGKNTAVPKLAMCAVLGMDKKGHYPHKHITYICNAPVPEKLYNRITWGFLFDWRWIERTLLFFHPMWQEYTYELLENESIVTPKHLHRGGAYSSYL